MLFSIANQPPRLTEGFQLLIRFPGDGAEGNLVGCARLRGDKDANGKRGIGIIWIQPREIFLPNRHSVAIGIQQFRSIKIIGEPVGHEPRNGRSVRRRRDGIERDELVGLQGKALSARREVRVNGVIDFKKAEGLLRIGDGVERKLKFHQVAANSVR